MLIVGIGLPEQLVDEVPYNDKDQTMDLVMCGDIATLPTAVRSWADARARLDMFDEFLFRHLNTEAAHELSKAGRRTLGVNAWSYTYGEIPSVTLVDVLHQVWHRFADMQAGRGVFIDIGHGSGRALFTAALLHRWHRVVGVEILPDLYQGSVDIIPRFQRLRQSLIHGTHATVSIDEDPLPSSLSSFEFSESQLTPSVELYCGDALKPAECKSADESAEGLESALRMATCVFMNSTCFDETFMRQISASLSEQLPPGTIILSLSRKPIGPRYRSLDSQEIEMSWGLATIHWSIVEGDPIDTHSTVVDEFERRQAEAIAQAAAWLVSSTDATE